MTQNMPTDTTEVNPELTTTVSSATIANIKVELKRLRRLLEHPRRNYWRKRKAPEKKYAKLNQKAAALAERLFELTDGESM